ncbi:MAG: geranylgeranyl reductase family protein [Candidatus Bathyarchaeia archaeon]
MRILDCDIIVVGAGPAGSLAARSAAERGARVILLEEHPQVGYPVSCAEGLSLSGIKDAGVEPKPPIVSQEITKARVYAPNRDYVELTSSDWRGYNLNRDAFDRALAENAVEAGAELMLNTRAKTVIWDGDAVSGVKATGEDGLLEIRAKVVIGADGYASVIRKTAGFGSWFPDVCTCAQFRLGNLDLDEPDVNDFLLGSNVAPGGYAWVFPKSNEVANVGVGVRRIHKAPPVEYLKRFVDSDSRLEGAKVLLVNGGICPVSGTLDKTVDDGIMLVGDAAGQLIPMTGAGVHSGVEAGKIAGEIAAEAAEMGDVSASRLSVYEKRFDEYWGKRISDSRKVLEMLDRFSDENLNTLARVITNEDIINLANGVAVTRTLARIVTRSPIGIIKLISAYIRG